MKRPEIGQVLTTQSGEKFRVSDVIPTHDPDDPDSDPEEFMVYLAPADGSDTVDWRWEDPDMLSSEFEAWCRSNGVSY